MVTTTFSSMVLRVATGTDANDLDVSESEVSADSEFGPRANSHPVSRPKAYRTPASVSALERHGMAHVVFADKFAPPGGRPHGIVGRPTPQRVVNTGLKRRRPYQSEAIHAVVERAERGLKRHLIILPTGTDKTFVATEMTTDLLQRPELANRRILIIAPTAEIANQNALGFEQKFTGHVGVLHSGEKPANTLFDGIHFVNGRDPQTRVVATTIQSLMAIGTEFDWSGFGVVIADEAHHYVPGNDAFFHPFQRLGFFDLDHAFINRPNQQLIGFTATPDRLDNSEGSRLVDVYGKDGIAYTRDVNDFISGQTGAQYLRTPHRIAVEFKAKDDSDKEITGREVWQRLSFNKRAEVIAGLIFYHPELGRQINQEIHPKRTILYVSNVAEANDMERELVGYGMNAKAVTGQTADRTARLEDFRNSLFDVLIGVGIPKEGFDVPGVEVVMLFGDDTESRSQVVQMVGRALRLDPNHPERTDAYIVDPWNLTEKHDVQMRGEAAYYQDGKVVSAFGAREGVSTGEIREKTKLASFVWNDVDLGEIIQPEDNLFAAELKNLFPDENALTVAAYRVGMNSDQLRSWWLGRLIPATLAETQKLEVALQISNQALSVAYQETTGMAIRTYLIERLKARAIELGHSPIGNEMGGEYPSQAAYKKYFNTWNAALKAAGLEVSRENFASWDKEKSIEHLNVAARTPLQSEGGVVPEGTKLTVKRYEALARENPQWPGYYTTLSLAITGNVSSWNEAKAAAGL